VLLRLMKRSTFKWQEAGPGRCFETGTVKALFLRGRLSGPVQPL